MDATASIDTPMAELIDRVKRGETVTLVEDGRPVATMVPAEIVPSPGTESLRVRAAVAAIRAEALAPGRQPVSVDEILAWRDEGRR